ncbi:guanine nucleotide binding protein, alpha subunit [Pilobolus umbonatus]|nr:guanine nucleotide binding protein, alpha subunit [Pilobolus umbonatus]
MGCYHSRNELEEKNREINAQLKKEAMNSRKDIKLLLLGTGDSGKSTVIKQMKIIHEGGFSSEEKKGYRQAVFTNTVESMQLILEVMEDLSLPVTHEYEKSLVLEQSLPLKTHTFPAELANAIQTLWTEKNIRSAYSTYSECQILDSTQYFLDSIERIANPSYIPNNNDILRARVKTIGITETIFHIGDLTYHMYDVGGQRSERKKWIHCFDNVMAIIFLFALSEYDQVLMEDKGVNRMEEAFILFESICNSAWFIKTSMILFLNKVDVFEEKIKRCPIHDVFADYIGSNTFDDSANYIVNRILSLNHSKSKQIYTHFTCATDTQQIKFVMAAVNDIVIQDCLRDVGLL